MEYCKYHPLQGASYVCHQCNVHTCQDCNRTEHQSSEARCFVCNDTLSVQGGAFTATPFWKRLNKAFKYPFSGNGFAAIIAATLLSCLGFIMPWFVLLASAFITKYSFTCLQQTAMGQTQAPDIKEAYGGGLLLLIQITGILLIGIASVTVIAIYVGPIAGIAAICFFVLSIPASFILLAMEESFFKAINPLKQLQLMTTIGWPYLFLCLILMIMLGSVEALSFMIDDNMESMSIFLQSAVSNYYSVVMYHLMGYALFQYQDKLGFVAEQDDVTKPDRTDQQLLQANVSVLVKEGDYEKAIKLYRHWLKKNPRDMVISDALFKLITSLKSKQHLTSFADQHLQLLMDNQQEFKLGVSLPQIKLIWPDYKPQQAKVRYQLAKYLFDKGDFPSTAKMLKDFHKAFPNDQQVLPAYKMMVETLEFIPGMDKQAVKFRAVVQKLEQQQPSESRAVKKKISFSTHHADNPPNLSLSPKVEDEEDKPLDYGQIEFTP
ncbi:hypothetical protein [Endozoicomonas ascidiicola]|uniref:hypothetical protein n=1 Tax=Endozoicomonas ascidiicola TaxID=1698521 RepID=UPI0008311971|nr:hypothetical protein [Endozoicomonas ascidiicola]